MAFTSYSNDPSPAIAGMVVERVNMRGRYENSEELFPGRLTELHSDGKLRLPQGTTLTKVVGAVPYISSYPTDGYEAGKNIVPQLRRGSMWVEYSGTAPAEEASVNVMHSSTIATHRGKVTASATSAVAGSEISAVEGLKCIRVDTTNSIALVEFNLPA
jgi:hypothetical protein